MFLRPWENYNMITFFTRAEEKEAERKTEILSRLNFHLNRNASGRINYPLKENQYYRFRMVMTDALQKQANGMTR